MVRVSHLFLLALLLGLLSQGWLWHVTTFTDEQLWIGRIVQLADDFRAGEPIVHDSAIYSEHPGMVTLLLASPLYLLGLDPLASLNGVVAVLISLTVACSVVVMKLLRPTSLWWIGAGGLLLFHPLFYQASPTDAVVSPLIVLLFLLGLWHFEKSRTPLRLSLAMGLVLGIALATRWHITVLMGGLLLFLLAWRIGVRRTAIIGGSSLVWMQALNVLLWYDPIVWFRWAIGGQVGYVTGSALHPTIDYDLTLANFVLFAPLALISIALACGMWLDFKNPHALDRRYFLILIVATFVPGSLILASRLQSLRYFFPLIFLWEAFLPLWLLFAVHRVKLSFGTRAGQARFHRLSAATLVSLLAFGQLFMLVYVHLLPVQYFSVDWNKVNQLYVDRRK